MSNQNSCVEMEQGTGSVSYKCPKCEYYNVIYVQGASGRYSISDPNIPVRLIKSVRGISNSGKIFCEQCRKGLQIHIIYKVSIEEVAC